MNLAFDIDDTITNSSDIFLKYAKLYNKENNIKHKILKNCLNQKEAFGWTKRNEKHFINKYLEKILIEAKPQRKALKVIKKLNKNNNIYLITSRNKDELSNIEEITLNWLKKYNIDYKYLQIGKISKGETCLHHDIKLFVDDNYQNCIDVANKCKCKVLLFDTRYNKKIKSCEIKRVKSWKEIEKKVKELQNGK